MNLLSSIDATELPITASMATPEGTTLPSSISPRQALLTATMTASAISQA
jgi:hypothetical protein